MRKMRWMMEIGQQTIGRQRMIKKKRSKFHPHQNRIKTQGALRQDQGEW
jgi:hypothetical protein